MWYVNQVKTLYTEQILGEFQILRGIVLITFHPVYLKVLVTFLCF